jgi:AcrR family transcriptional regulator
LKKIDSILDAALAVFRKSGFDGATMDDVAARAEVSVGTAYGYFSTKENLLLGLVARHRFIGAALRRPLVDKPASDAVQAMVAYEESVLDASLRTFDRSVWKHVQSAWMLQGQSGMGKLIGEMERRLIKERTEILHALKERGAMSPDLPIGEIAEILHAAGLLHWERYLADEYSTIDEAKEAIRRLVRLIVQPVQRTRGNAVSGRGIR